MCRVVTTRHTTLFVGFATPRTIEWKIKSEWSGSYMILVGNFAL
jgi:hypothetical protein